MTTIITNIQRLVNVREESHLLFGKTMASVPCIENAYLIIEGDQIAAYGPMSDLPKSRAQSGSMYDANGAWVFPSWCDSHTHLVFAGSREDEFVDKIKGLSYAQINARGGGILNSAKKLGETSENELFNLAWKRLQDLIAIGTGSIEIKSGYGLSVDGELKMLRVIKKLKAKSPIVIKASFLGAHTYPLEYRANHAAYIDLIIQNMLPIIAKEGLADYIDVFCEDGFFSPEETESICVAGLKYGLKPKLHTNQLNSTGGIQVGMKLGAISLDHLETLTDKEIYLLSHQSSLQPASKEVKGLAESWRGVCTLLPGAAFFLRMPFPPARELIDRGAAVALASDFNPGSCPSGNMNMVVSLACIQMKMLPEEALNAASINGAYAMELGEETGSITRGKKANFFFTEPMTSLAFLPYAFGSNLIKKVMIQGDWIK
jgi:imidazolonepropionase